MKDQSSLHNILDGIESKLKYRTNPKVLDSKITSDLNYFKESMQKTYQSKLIDEKFLPDYKSDKFDHKIDKKPYLSSAVVGSSLNATSEFEIRKVMEREMDPYIYSAKNELKLIIDGFMKDLGDYKYIKNETNLVKETVQDNKKLILIFQEDFEKKFMDYTQKFLNINKQFDEVKSVFSDFTKRVKNFEKMYENLQEKTFYIDTVREKINNFESNNEKMYKNLEDNINFNYSSRFRNIESNIDNLKTSGNSMNSTISSLSMNFNSLQNMTQTLEESNKKLIDEVAGIREKCSALNLSVSNNTGKCEALNNMVSNLNEKCSSLSKNYTSINENVNSLCIEFDQLVEKVDGVKIANENKIEKLESNYLNNHTNTANTTAALKNEISTLKEALKEANSNNKSVNGEIDVKFTELENLIKNQIEVIQKSVSENISNKENKSNDSQNNDHTNSQPLSNPVYEKSITELVKQSMNFAKDIASIKEEQSRFEENFEAIQENFESINTSVSENIDKTSKIEKSQNLVNEIIKAMTVNSESFKKNVEIQFGNLEKWKEVLIENLKKNYGEMKSDLETKINNSLNEGGNSYRSGANNIKNKTPNLMNEEYFDKQIKTYDDKISQIYKKISEIDQINQKLSENEEKIGKIFHYFEPKIEEIVECINLICSKYDVNLNIPPTNLQNVDPNPNNMTNSNILNALQNSNLDKSTMHYLPIYPSCYVSNSTPHLILKGSSEQKIEFQVRESGGDNSGGFDNIRSRRNTIDESFLKFYSNDSKKFKNNLLYQTTHPLNFQEVETELKGYLKKYLFFQKHYENVIEVDFDLNQDENDQDGDIDGKDNLKNINPIDRLSKSSGRIFETREKKDQLVPVDLNDDMFCEDLDDFDRDSDADEIQHIINRNEDEQRRDKEVKSRTLKNLLNDDEI